MADKIIRKLTPITSADELKLEPIPDEVVESLEKNIDALSGLVGTTWKIPQGWSASSGYIDGLRASCTNIDEIHDLHIDIPYDIRTNTWYCTAGEATDAPTDEWNRRITDAN